MVLHSNHNIDETFYAGIFTPTGKLTNGHPDYVRASDNVTLYVNNVQKWVLGDSVKNDFIFVMSSSENLAFSPEQWPKFGPEWEKSSNDDHSSIHLRLADPNFFPPGSFTILPFVEIDELSTDIFVGSYSIVMNSMVQDRPHYTKDDSKSGTFIKISDSQKSWILGNENKNYIFTMNLDAVGSPRDWDNQTWEHQGTEEIPIFQLTNPMVLPPKELILSATADSIETFYAGNYKLSNNHRNYTPQYVRSNNESILLYRNDEKSWVLGNQDYQDYVLTLSNGDYPTFSPSQWPEWSNTNREVPEVPDLVLNDHAFLPPLHINLEPNNKGDDTFYGGSYTLELRNEESGMPQYVKDGQESIRLYVSSSIESWVLGTSSHQDFIFNMSSSTDSLSPLKWEEWTWDNRTFSEQPTVRLKDPQSLPPLHITLLPHMEDGSPLYDGHYLLNITTPRNGFPQYLNDDNQTLLYFNNDELCWKLGDFTNEYIFNMSRSSFISPTHWSDDDYEWTNEGTLEMPQLKLKDYLSQPPWQITLAPRKNSDTTFYQGTYNVDLTDLHNFHPQYTQVKNESIKQT